MASETPGAGAARILVVDDEPSIVDAVATALRYEGFEVRRGDARAAARSLPSRDFEPDLIVLDWMLPDIEGIEVGRRLRERGFKTAILFLTAKDAVENKVEALRAGGDDYVTKPFSLAELVARVQAILRRTGERAARATCLRFADVDARRGAPRGLPRRDARRADRNRVQPAALLPAQPAPRALEGADPRRTCGATTSAATRTSSRPTSATCARSSTRPARR